MALTSLFACALSPTSSRAAESFTHEMISVVVSDEKEAPSERSDSRPAPTSIGIKVSDPAIFHVFLLDNPSRLVVDVEGLSIRSGARIVPKVSPLIRKIRFGPHDTTSRIVFDLALECGAPTEVQTTEKRVSLDLIFENRGPESSAPAKAQNCVVRVADLPVSKVESAVTGDPEESLVVTPNIEASALALGASIVRFESSSRPVQDVLVRNASNTILSVANTVNEVEGPDSDKVLSGSDAALVVSPRQMNIGPHEERVLRILLKNELNDRERYYRVEVHSVTPSEDGSPATPPSKASVISLLAIVPPKEPNEQISGRRQDGQFVIENSGNIGILLEEGQICSRESGHICTPLSRRWLLAGTNWPLPVAGAASIRFLKRTGEAIQPLTYDVQ